MNAILAIAWRSLKNSGLQWGFNPLNSDANATLYSKLSYEATNVGSWSFVGSTVPDCCCCFFFPGSRFFNQLNFDLLLFQIFIMNIKPMIYGSTFVVSC